MTDLTDRMRTCAAAIVAGAPDQPFMEWQLVYRDAADLLIEASNIIEAACEPYRLGEPMEIIEPAVLGIAKLDPETMKPISPAVWVDAGDTLPIANPYRSLHTCPKCDSRAGKTVRRRGNRLMLACPVCGNEWPHTKKPPAGGP